jgi:hypothetical protein
MTLRLDRGDCGQPALTGRLAVFSALAILQRVPGKIVFPVAAILKQCRVDGFVFATPDKRGPAELRVGLPASCG